MSPKEMIEGQIAEFNALHDSMRTMEEAYKGNQKYPTLNGYYAGRAETYRHCAIRLGELLKLKGWE